MLRCRPWPARFYNVECRYMHNAHIAPRGFASIILVIAVVGIFVGAGYWYWARIYSPAAQTSPTTSEPVSADKSATYAPLPVASTPTAAWQVSTTTLATGDTWTVYTSTAGFRIALPSYMQVQSRTDRKLELFYQSPKDSTPTVTITIGLSDIEGASIAGNTTDDLVAAVQALQSSSAADKRKSVTYSEQTIGGFDTVRVALTGWTVDIGGDPSTQTELWFTTSQGLVAVIANADAEQIANSIFKTLN